MFSFLYDLVLGFYLFLQLPSLLFSKKNRNAFQKFALPNFKSSLFKTKSKIVWVHSVSLGEAKAASVLISQVKSKEQVLAENSFFVIHSVTTQTGFEEAKKGLADQIVFMPFDFSFLMRRLGRKIQPDLIIFVETDFWYHFVKYMKKAGSKTAVISGKLSKRSFRRLQFFTFFAKKLFSLFDLIAVQNKTYQKRFSQFAENIKISPNLKFFHLPKKLSPDTIQTLKNKLNIQESDQVITIASTHEPEEKLLLEELKTFIADQNNLKILLAPRHPERFKEVACLLKNLSLPFTRLSALNSNSIKDSANLILIDSMGFLNQAFSISHLAIVAGSFVPKIGGHNILEPVFFDLPVIFGPYMHDQQELKNIALKEKIAVQTDLKNVKEIINFFLKNIYKQKLFQTRCQAFTCKLQTEKELSWNLIKNLL